MGKFFCVGLGPGDPELLTYKAVKTIHFCNIIALPASGSSSNIAAQIAEEHLRDKEIREYSMPMVKDKNEQERHHREAAVDICMLLKQGNNVAFLTLGDPSIYSTAMYVHKFVKEAGFPTAVIPGVTSFSAAAAALDTSLCDGGNPLHIIPASYEGFEEQVKLNGTKVLMKSGKALNNVKKYLQDNGIDAFMVSNASMKNEKVYRCINDIDGQAGYFSLLVIKENCK